MRLRTFLKPLSFLPAILMMYVIFLFSSQEADLSSSISSRASYMLVKGADYLLDTNLEEWQIQNYAEKIHGVTRKLAHMTEYFLLAISVSFPLYVYGLHGILLVLTAGFICVGYAGLDEYHQSLVAGRSASVKDVCIDGIGVLAGIIVVRIIGWTGRHTIFRPLPDRRVQKRNARELKDLKKRQMQMEEQLREEREASYNNRSNNKNASNAGGYYRSPYEDRYDERYGRGSQNNGYGRGSEGSGYGRDPYDERYRRSDERYDDRYRGGDERYDERYRRGDEGYDDRYRRDSDRRSYDYPDEDLYDEDYYEYEEEPSSDELSEDMPLSKLFRK